MISRLYIMQLKYAGIPNAVYDVLPEHERAMLINVDGKFFLKPEQRKKIKVVLTGGVFDVLHIGHIVTLNEAKKHGDVLIVAIAQDEHIRKKNREPIHPLEYRTIMVEALKPVDLAVSGFDDPKKMLDAVKPDAIVYGYDQKETIKTEGVTIIRLSKCIDDSKFKTGKILDELGI